MPTKRADLAHAARRAAGGARTMGRVGGKQIFELPASPAHLRCERTCVAPDDITMELWTRVRRARKPCDYCGRACRQRGRGAHRRVSPRAPLRRGPSARRRIELVGLLRRTLAARVSTRWNLISSSWTNCSVSRACWSTATPRRSRAAAVPVRRVKTLLLSATPYKMFSRAQELDDDHHAEFLGTTDFLLDDAERCRRIGRGFGDYRAASSGLRQTTATPR